MTVPNFFYGWYMVGGAVVCLFAWMGVSQAAAGVFLKPVVEDLGWQVWQFTLGASLASAAGGLSGIFAGSVVDRRGPRLLILVGALVAAVCLWGLSRQSHLWMFLALYAVGGLLGWNLFSSTVVNPTITKWFVRKRGWALALGSIGVSLASLIAPVTMTFIVDIWDWRVGYAAMGAFILVAVLPVAFIMRRTPEDYGLLPDGDSEEPTYIPGQAARSQETVSFTRWEAVRTGAFWLLLLGFAFNMAALISVLVHAIPFLTDAGFPRITAASALAVNGLGNLASKAAWGYGLQRVHPRLLVLTAFMISTTGVASDTGRHGYRVVCHPVSRLLPVRLWVRGDYPAGGVHVGEVFRQAAYRRDPGDREPGGYLVLRTGAYIGWALVRLGGGVSAGVLCDNRGVLRRRDTCRVVQRAASGGLAESGEGWGVSEGGDGVEDDG